MEHLLDQFKNWIVASIGDWGYLAVFVLNALESACIPIPSEITMPVAGLLAHEGRLSFFWAAVLGAVANLAGSWIAYLVGRGGGRPILLRYGRYILIKPHDIERADRWFERYGDRAVLIARLLPVIRTFISLPAGVARVPFWRFSLLTLIGCLPWSFALTGAGYLLGENWERILPFTEPVSYTIAAGVAIMVGWWVIKRVRSAGAPG